MFGGPQRPEGLPVGAYVQPTIFADVDPASAIAQEEIFGPVLTIIPYADEEEAVAIANGTLYGLTSGVFGEPEHALAVARRLRVGQVDVNGGALEPARPVRRLQAVRQRPRVRPLRAGGVPGDQVHPALSARDDPPAPFSSGSGGTPSPGSSVALDAPVHSRHTVIGDTVDRAQLASFLRTRREALQPEDVGLPRGPRRRTGGLRREEVATLSGMSTDYYSRLEQQRGPHPSEQMLAALARGLRLSLTERDHLFQLAGHAVPAARCGPTTSTRG